MTARSSEFGYFGFLLLATALALAPACSDSSSDGGDGDPVVPETLHFTTGEFDVPAAQETTRCIYFDLPVARDYLVHAYRANMLAGSHHFNMFYAAPNLPGLEDVPRGELVDCDDAYKFYLAGSQWTEIDSTFPDGVGLRIPQGSILAMETHYVNSSDVASVGKLDVEFDELAPSDLVNELGLYFGYMQDIHLDPGERARLAGHCTLDADVNLTVLTSHMHHFGQRFTMDLIDEDTAARTPIYVNEEWNHPLLVEKWDEPIVTGPRQTLEWACEYDNATSQPVVGGSSAETNEMCIAAVFYWPKVRVNPYCLDNARKSPLP